MSTQVDRQRQETELHQKILEERPDLRCCALCDNRDPANPPPGLEDPRWNWLCRDCACTVIDAYMNERKVSVSGGLIPSAKIREAVRKGLLSNLRKKSWDGEFGDQK